jgi:hypothetical protein
MMILGPPLREKGHEVAGGVCFKEEHGEHEMRRVRETGERGSRLLVSEANVSTMLFLDRMVLAVNGYLFLDG